MARKTVVGDQLVKLLVGAGQASPSPPVGPALGSKGVKSMDFCKEFNARTAHYIPGTLIPALVTVRPDRSFTFQLRTPPTASLLMAAAGVEKTKNRVRGAGNTGGPNRLGREVAGLAAGFAKAASTTSAGNAGAEPAAEGDATAAAEAGKSAEGQGEGQQDGRERYSARITSQGKASGKELNGNASRATVGTVSLKHVYEIAKIKASEPRLSGLSLEGIAKSVIAQAGSMGVVVVP